MRFFSLLFLLSFVTTTAKAQADFTRQLMSSGRYEVRKTKAVTKKSRRPSSENEISQPAEASVEASATAKVQTVPSTEHVPVAEAVEVKPVELPEAPKEIEEPQVVEQVKTLFGSDDSAIRLYEEKVHPDDPRLNRLEIEGRAGFTSVKSSSNYSFRDYQSSFATMDLKSNVWMVPGFGLTGSIRFSMGGSVRGDDATQSMDRVRDEEMMVGFLFRRHFGLSRLSPSLEFSVLYLDHSFNVSTDSTTRPRWNSNGLGLGLESRLPTSAEHAWILGGRFFPRLKHSESKTSISVESGEPGENIRLDLFAGGELSFGKGHSFIYGLEVGAERDQFDGPASVPDPKSGVTPSNVTVTNALLNFSFGYRWGR